MRPLSAAATVAIVAATLSAPAIATPVVCNAVWTDAARSGRAVPVRIRMPEGSGRAPVILFSHGLGGDLDAGTDWVTAWNEAGFMTVNIQHAGIGDLEGQDAAHAGSARCHERRTAASPGR